MSQISSKLSRLVSHTSGSSTCCPVYRSFTPCRSERNTAFTSRTEWRSMTRIECAPPEKRLQCRCLPQHLWSSVLATFNEFVIHFVGLQSKAGPSTSVHCSPNGQWSPTILTTTDHPTTHSFSLVRCAHAERISRRRFGPCTTHTQRSSAAGPDVPTPSISRNLSPGSAAAQRGNPTNKCGFSCF